MIAASSVLARIPESLRTQLLTAFQEILRNYRDARWEPSELNGGKFCEAAYTILKGHVDNNFPASASKPSNMLDACRSLEAATGAPRSVRIQIPRMLIALYEIRNNRGVGHIGGDVDPNRMDATAVVAMAKWTMAELVRVFHGVDTHTAAAAVESIVERDVPIIWEVAGKQRILDTALTMKEKTLLLLYKNTGPVKDKNLVLWLEHSNASVFRRDVLRPCHKEKLIEFDETLGDVHISPMGINLVETSPRLNRYFRG